LFWRQWNENYDPRRRLALRQAAYGRSAITEFLGNGSYSAQSRAALLSVFAANDLQSAHPIIRELAVGSGEGDLQKTAINELLRFDVETAWPLIQARVAESGKQALIDLPALYDTSYRQRAFDASPWSAQRLLELARMLYELFPPLKGEQLDGWVTPDKELVWLRERIPCILANRSTADDRQVLAQLVHEQPAIRSWFSQVEAISVAGRELDPMSGGPILGIAARGTLPIAKVLDLLDNPGFRMVRQSDDLQEVLAELLDEIGLQVGRFSDLLFVPGNETTPKHVSEAALQAYLACRLTDLLPQRVGEGTTEVIIVREPRENFRRRTDLLVKVPTIFATLAEVVIEVKWSDNRTGKGVSNSLCEQLGNQYLLAEQRTHGVFMVGWAERVSWRKAAGKKPTTIDELRQALSQQAADYKLNHPGIKIIPVVTDFRWQTGEDADQSARRARNRSRRRADRNDGRGRSNS
jgi:hypothetical protein